MDLENEICVDMGICLPSKGIELLISRKQYIADNFAREIFAMEGLSPDLELKLFRQVKRRFTDKYGNELANS